jgi:nucleotide-binding universal stress UspA family protein
MTGEIRAGPVARTVTQAARDHSADLIVLGTTGRRLARVPLLPTTARKVERQASCPVQVVR